ncbi:MAG TPA: hypothetical protein PKK06_17880 [Phycisphaerae bacterium]|nr:hypothetical protein [Phycisphaerae bacterium]HNU47094.1 hypothetical protein [Phycisphaerae bacterium]
MHSDVFGDLREWGRVLEELQQLTRGRALDGHQDALLRLLRYRDNWRLREAALEAVRSVSSPSEALLTEVTRIMSDATLYNEVRVLAAEALAQCIATGRADKGRRNAAIEQQAIDQMHALLDTQQPPVLHQAIRRVLPTVE